MEEKHRESFPLISDSSCPILDSGSHVQDARSKQSNAAAGQEALVYRVEEIAQMLAISLRGAYNLCNSTKDFRVLHIGNSIRIPKASFDAWFEQSGL